jgi:galactofuranosylgalactofuranosylrhamnosyl-N-acetylglucosaminyl-diphospho-decaprenol beta-1,5/1,6-galactofuranosyltransferase
MNVSIESTSLEADNKINNMLPNSQYLVQEITFPDPQICSSPELYVHMTSDGVIDRDQKFISLRKRGILDIGTYFNSLSVDKWRKYTQLSQLSIFLKIQGRFKVDVCTFSGNSGNRVVIYQKEIESKSIYGYTSIIAELDLKNLSGLLYLRIEALSDDFRFAGGVYSSTQEPINKILIALVTCTYRREQMVEKTARNIARYFSDRVGILAPVEMIVVDNGNTLNDFNELNNVYVVPNKNSGGSGGFARGMMEALSKDRFTHIILMDDDIVIDPTSIARVATFLSYSKDDSIPIAGSMVKLEEQHRLYESGAGVDSSKNFIPRKQGLDLRELSSVAFSDTEEYFMYGAWWFYCMATKVVQENGLPYPFFLRFDDVEYGLRLNRPMLTLNGCCVWHESFLAKEKPTIEYYYTRNSLILASRYFKNDKLLSTIVPIVKRVVRHVFMYRYENARYILKGIEDFLAGPQALKDRDPEAKNKELMLSKKEMSSDQHQATFVYSKYQDSINQQESALNRLIRVATLNGHLLPDLLFQPSHSPLSTGFRIVPMLSARPLNLFRARKALYYDTSTKSGYLVHFSRIECVKILWQLLRVMVVFSLCFRDLRSAYSNSFNDFTSTEFWREYLNLKES